MRNVLKKFLNCSIPSQQVGEPDQPVYEVLFSRKAVRVLCIVLVSSHSFGVGIVHSFFFFFGFLTL